MNYWIKQAGYYLYRNLVKSISTLSLPKSTMFILVMTSQF